jgi:hypothetical protein
VGHHNDPVLALGISADAQRLNAIVNDVSAEVQGVGLHRWRLDTYEELDYKNSASSLKGFGFTFIRECTVIGAGDYGWMMRFIDNRSFTILGDDIFLGDSKLLTPIQIALFESPEWDSHRTENGPWQLGTNRPSSWKCVNER